MRGSLASIASFPKRSANHSGLMGEPSSRVKNKFGGHRSGRDLRDKAVLLGVAQVVFRETGGRPRQLLVAAEEAEEAEKGPWWTRPTFTSATSSGTSASSAL